MIWRILFVFELDTDLLVHLGGLRSKVNHTFLRGEMNDESMRLISV
jgi:hypothetical protein